jgi:hypothetical protein
LLLIWGGVAILRQSFKCTCTEFLLRFWRLSEIKIYCLETGIPQMYTYV